MLRILQSDKLAAYQTGVSDAELARQWGCSKPGVAWWRNKHKLPPNQPRQKAAKVYVRELTADEHDKMRILWKWIIKAQRLGVDNLQAVDGAISCARYEITGKEVERRGKSA